MPKIKFALRSLLSVALLAFVASRIELARFGRSSRSD